MNYLSKCITTWLIKHETVSQGDRELYEYATYSFLLSLSPLIIIMIIGLMMGQVVASIWVILPFMFIRKFSGGFHAKHAWVCMIFSCGILFLCVFIVAYIEYSIWISIITVCAATSLTIFSPIDSENRQLDLSEIKKYKITTTILVIAFVILHCLFLLTNHITYAICIAEGIVLTACLQVPHIFGKLKLVSETKNRMLQ